MTINEFIATHRLEMSVLPAHMNPNAQTDSWGKNASHWSCKIVQVGFGNPRTLITFFSMGSAHKGKPQIADVLDCLASDASSVDNARGFENWAADLGYDTDSREAEATYKACVKGRGDLRAFLGADAYNALLDAERL